MSTVARMTEISAESNQSFEDAIGTGGRAREQNATQRERRVDQGATRSRLTVGTSQRSG